MERIPILWQEAAAMDPTLALRRSDLEALRKKQLRARPFVKGRLFSRMVRGVPSLVTGFPVSLKHATNDRRRFLADLIRTGFPSARKARVQTGRTRTLQLLRISEVIRRWERNRAIVGVSDLHFRRTKFAQAIEFSALSDFDILNTNAELTYLIEMMTLVISSKGNVTDSHQDDCDGSNHCFIGMKLWLVWNRLEGKAKGFEDVDRDKLTRIAAFDMPTFLSLPSATWFIIKADQTLFLPGTLAHKVITLEPYIGIGGFHVSLPGYVRSLRSWILYETLDIGPAELLAPINALLIKKIHQLRRSDSHTRERWGFSYLRTAIRFWERNESDELKTVLLRHPAFAALIQIATLI